MVAQLPGLESIRSSLYRARHENTPILPTHRRDVSLSTRFTKTRSGEDFLLVDDGVDDKIMIFATEENLKLMCDAEAFYIDGTFSTCPSFYQVFSFVTYRIHAQTVFSLNGPFFLQWCSQSTFCSMAIHFQWHIAFA